MEQYEGVVNNNNVDSKNKGKAIQLGDDDVQLEVIKVSILFSLVMLSQALILFCYLGIC